MGKTVSCQAFAVEMCDERRTGKGRGALYFDLRRVTKSGVLPELNDIMTICANDGWYKDMGKDFTTDQIWEWIDAGAVVIFDGLDEVMNAFDDERDGPKFAKRLLSVVDQINHRRLTVPGPAPRVLISSRTEFYPTLRAERARFVDAIGVTAELADGIKARVLLPLDDDQVKEYLIKTLPDKKDTDSILEMIHSTQDMNILVTRPMTLSMVSKQVPLLERKKANKEPVFACTIYRELAREWATRDNTKTKILGKDRLWIAEQLAAELARRTLAGQYGPPGRPSKSVELMPYQGAEDWLLSLCQTSARLALRYSKTDPQLLLQDLRNATFLRRFDESADEAFFEFAHTSLREFFLSEYLVDGLERNDPSTWSMPLPSTETLGFVAQTLAEPGHADHVKTLREWVAQAKDTTGSHDPQLASMFLAYAVALRKQEGWKAKDIAAVGVDLRGIDLADADLGSRPIVGIDLTGANLTQAKLGRGVFVDCVLDDANLTGLSPDGGWIMDGGSARRSEWTDVKVADHGFRGADLGGAIWGQDVSQAWFAEYEPDDSRLSVLEKSSPRPINMAIPRNELKKFVRGSMRDAGDIESAISAIREGIVVPWNKGGDRAKSTIALGGYIWRVLDKSTVDGASEALLLAEHIVDLRPFHERFVDITWEDSSIREWLNLDFLSGLPFSDRIIDSDNYDMRSPRATMRNTTDGVFLLSYDEIRGYLPKQKDRIGTRWDGKDWVWWLRSSGDLLRGAAVVRLDGGDVSGWNLNVGSGYVGVRPALRINLES